MKNILSIIAFSLSLAVAAQGDKEVNIDNFHTIKAYDLINVQLVKSDVNKLEIKGKDSDNVTYVFKDGLLKLRMDTNKIFDGNNTYVTVFYTDLKTIDANEGAEIYAKDISGQDSVEIKTQEGARVVAGVDLNKIDVRAVTGGIVELHGKVIKQNVTVNTGGIVENRELKSETTEVKVQAGGEVEVYASKSVDARVRAGGDIIVYGNPKNVNQKSLFGGDIVIK
ncbi:Putative auto-transporter adhesin, head GIN domain [Nonlabens sp. Hel1_33_55]|uniref:head GIN domain-containing protein n=1 Tax=Nonlabens sp. Hel1_33_55 TaxID=1336802 RepID=UPI000875BB94|nr:head GIN domain-containing protein [Nonlabens sp. Hel1_33_55]SCY33507.1 Putative auto-transporter adhesin, head GIN domain [Nonlabens sp. Hel1_33_55]